MSNTLKPINKQAAIDKAFIKTVYTARDSIITQLSDINVTCHIDQAVILGSGLSGLELEGFSRLAIIDYQNIEGLPTSTAPSHAGKLELVSNGIKTIALCSGRQHLYEGYSAQEVCTLVYVLSTLGVHTLFITNAAGALNPEYQPGDIMLINDHINFTGHNPLIGQNQHFGLTFPDMSQAYDTQLANKLRESASSQALNLQEGIYIGVSGPSLETSAERRMFRGFGADAVGMSTVLEVIAAKHVGLQVTGLSAITNLALGDEHQKPDTIEEVLAHAALAGKKIKALLEDLLSQSQC